MKIKFTKSVEFVPIWRGNDKSSKEEQFNVVLKVLEFNDLLFLMDKFQKKTDDGNIDIRAVAEAAGQLLPKYVELKNLVDEETGDQVLPEEIVAHPVFMDLVSELLTKLSEISTPTKGDEKN